MFIVNYSSDCFDKFQAMYTATKYLTSWSLMNDLTRELACLGQLIDHLDPVPSQNLSIRPTQYVLN